MSSNFSIFKLFRGQALIGNNATPGTLEKFQRQKDQHVKKPWEGNQENGDPISTASRCLYQLNSIDHNNLTTFESTANLILYSIDATALKYLEELLFIQEQKDIEEKPSVLFDKDRSTYTRYP